jgi:uncharacterized membrane protein YeaQ/YmgE (transglycosylase-associated protein family)
MIWILGVSGNGSPKYLLFLLAWLAGAAIAGYLSERKGYGDKPGLVTGLVLSLVGALIWVFVPPRANADWKIKGPFGSQRKDSKS